ncbi:hypothetical protein HPP92_015482 [Vanilla planifolia]|uniref:Uncharacterized protein n=1 Tax=Vanilla planifolia TaxID=51239 RepID=A0A835QNN5_VANPL|nr:hypothetical protein HPP92_015482 [Vanilla planifolia]
MGSRKQSKYGTIHQLHHERLSSGFVCFFGYFQYYTKSPCVHFDLSTILSAFLVTADSGSAYATERSLFLSPSVLSRISILISRHGPRSSTKGEKGRERWELGITCAREGGEWEHVGVASPDTESMLRPRTAHQEKRERENRVDSPSPLLG